MESKLSGDTTCDLGESFSVSLTELEEYRDKVKRHAAEKNGQAFFNGSADHAAIIFESLLESANSSIRILSRRLDNAVYGRDTIVQKLIQFLGRDNTSVEILVEDGDADISLSHPFAIALKGHGDKVSVWQLPESVASSINYRFAVSDNGYRFQPDKNEKWKAFAAFGDTKGHQKLNELFDSLLQVSRAGGNQVDIG
jgi:hypothetical protein